VDGAQRRVCGDGHGARVRPRRHRAPRPAPQRRAADPGPRVPGAGDRAEPARRAPDQMGAATGGDRMRVLRYSAILTGVAVLVYGVYGLLTAPEIPRLSGVAYWLLGGVALHDAVLAPAVFALCWLAARRTTP